MTLKEKAKAALQATDWIYCSDIAIDNKAEFETYRELVRAEFFREGSDTDTLNDVPAPPDPIWTE
jgi:hypothetical protein